MGYFLVHSFLIITSLLCSAHANPELKALMELKTSLDPGGKILSSWSSNRDPRKGDFEGVACNEHGKVANISLQGKGLKGALSPALTQLKCLNGLYLHYNALKGEIPREITNLTELAELYLNDNNLTGSIPSGIGNMASLQVMQLCYNQITGSIPTQIGLLKKLNVLALQSNWLTGAIPASLGDLTALTRLDLSFNQLFGSIPVRLAQLPSLVVLDVRNNSLSGIIPPEFSRLQKGFKYENNTGLCGTGFSSLRICTEADQTNQNGPKPFSAGLTSDNTSVPSELNPNCTKLHCNSRSLSSSSVAAIVTVVAFCAVSVVAGLFTFAWYRHRYRSNKTNESTKSNGSLQRSPSSLISIEYNSCWDPLANEKAVSESLRFNLEEVECATQYFSEANILGKRGGFGLTTSYKGTLRDGTNVVVKRINKTSCKQEDAEFLKGLKLVLGLKHENIVGLKGFCCSRGRGECFLVYDCVPNGSLVKYLDLDGEKNGYVIDWPTRISIIKGIAKGIAYLHSTKPNKPSLVHQAISAEKILLDYNYKPLISGSGLHKLLADDAVFSTLKASAAMGYLAPEYTTTGRFTEKSDVYAFGVVVLQILGGNRKVSNLRLAPESGGLEELVDKNLKGNYRKNEAANLANIALSCLNEVPSQRPSMEDLFKEL
ncbi:hypothetical protein LUZ63_001590 [Rhynchospora breviuscula]|uniref:Protein kinase domain-containing protein n=1 Tax=Rhynchospora breviuscula TaxID=2022672 RepID=A0A9Q0CX57_9POAL|nr:hypothetical protein LUZ63_001590 [Rhynchospora breviuscula]